ncbi:MAG: RluA family pseudouridine synthase [Lachnospiraceae bacterium]|nr:RluA family pseudouridine synthase [Lachnospiraceae bacterium]MBP3507133.1 RluA family pseudouridine synthase [Lachnospiraceae bacterium]
MEIKITSEQVNNRIDKLLSDLIPELSRSYIQKLLSEGNILVNNTPVKSNYKLRLDDTISVTIPEPEDIDILPEDIPLDIVFEDEDILIVNKPKGMVVHPAAGHYTGTLVNAIMYHCKDQLSSINGVLRPGIVHRIDMDTTGLLVVCKNDLAHQSLAEQLKVHSITRKYYAIVYDNIVEDEGTINKPIGRHPTDRKKQTIDLRNGREAITHYRVLERLNGKYTFIECQLETGRTHQIRVHMSSIHHPILGDTVYGPDKNPYHLQGQTLHAGVLGFQHPRTGNYVEFQSELPDYFEELLKQLRK